MTTSASSTGAALVAMGENSDVTESQIFAALPNPVFVLDREIDLFISTKRRKFFSNPVG